MKFVRGNILFYLIIPILFMPAVLLSAAANVNIDTTFTIFQDFRAVMMYYSEAFLSGASFGTQRLEGEIHLVIARKLINAINYLEIDYDPMSRRRNDDPRMRSSSDDPRIERLKAFRKQLTAGCEVAAKLDQFPLGKRPEDIVRHSKEVQNIAIAHIDNKDLNGIVIPSGWVGHATALIIKKSKIGPDLYDLVYVNSGSGLEYHYTKADPDKVYPHLSRLGLEFKGIPKSKIFDPNTAWLFYALYTIKNESVASNLKYHLEQNDGDLPSYFYGSILANFYDYLAIPTNETEETEKLFPEQQSGSCSMSSLMAALLYFSDSLETFHWYRLKIGHVLLENLLIRLQEIINTAANRSKTQMEAKRILLLKGRLGEDDPDFEFLSILKDSFFSGGKRFFQGLIRSLAFFQLQYLENKFPIEFKNAGLIGTGRSTWIKEKKAEAIGKLESDETAVPEIARTVRLAEIVNRKVLSLEHRPDTTHIQNFSEIHGYFANEKFYLENSEGSSIKDTDEAVNLKFNFDENGNIYSNVVKGVPERLEIESDINRIDSFDDFYNSFEDLYQKSDNYKEAYFMRFLDIFRRLRSGSGWSIFHNHQQDKKILKLQEMCKTIALKFAELSNSYTYKDRRKISMDEVALLGHIQFLSWHLFQAYHNLYDRSNKIKWDNLVPPLTIQTAILPYNESEYALSGFLKKWPIKGFNDVENYHLYELFIKEGRSEVKSKSNRKYYNFPGPEEFISVSGGVRLNLQKFKNYMKDENLKLIFENFMNHPHVETIFQKLKTYCRDWDQLDRNYAYFLIVVSAHENELYQAIPHYYNLMYTLQCLKLSVKSRGLNSTNRNFWLTRAAKPEHVQLLLHTKHYYTIESLYYVYSDLEILRSNTTASDLFYALRHTYALPKEIGMTDLDTWLNYIKSAKTAKIFDSPFFQYMTDHLLNIPKYRGDSHNATLLFNEETARTIILEMTKLIENALKKLLVDSIKLTASNQEKIVRRVVNMAVITTRFISRADYEFDGSNDPALWSSLLANLYNIIEPYSSMISSTLIFTDVEISMLHFTLSHMCFIRLRESDNFTQAIRLGFDYHYKRYRRTLARVHWFIAKIEYASSANGQMIADDQFKYGFLGSPLDDAEIRFFETLLKKKFLHRFTKTNNDYSFRYDSGRYVVEISTNHRHPGMRLLINLATGAIIENGALLSSKSLFINSNEFRAYFSTHRDQQYLSSMGKAFVYHGIPVFVLPTFKESEYFMINYKDKFWLLRRWKKSWYIWRPEEVCKPIFQQINYFWNGNSIKTFEKYKSTSTNVEMIIFDEEGRDPILKITKLSTSQNSNYHSSYLAFVPGLTDGKSAKIINNTGYMEIHLKNFAEEGMIYSRQESDGTIVVIYNNHRLPEDPYKPVVLTAAADQTIRVQNVPNMKICKDQRIGKDAFGLPVCLVASYDGKKVLLVPFAEVLKKSTIIFPPPRSYIKIEKVPMLEQLLPNGRSIAVPDPQSRMHKMLLAYYMILAQDYNSARKLLHPATSIHHNSVFSKDELQIIEWILRINMNSPEFKALSLIFISHFLINDAKFSFNYTEEVKDIAKMLKNMSPSQTFYAYMMSIRQLPEKYYIYKIFPDILIEKTVLSNVFFAKELQISATTKKPEKFEFPDEFPSPFADFNFGDRQNMGNLLFFMNANLHSDPLAKLTKYLLFRNSRTEIFETGIEMAMYCYSMDPSLWEQFKSKFKSQTNKSNYKAMRPILENEFNRAMSRCRFNNQFYGISLAALSKSTNIKDIQATFRNDTGIYENYHDEVSDHLITINTEEEKDKLLSFRLNLLNSINKTGSDSAESVDYFAPALVESSTVLRNLSSSIISFVLENGAHQLNNLNLRSNASLFSDLQKLNEFLILRISFLEEKQKNLSDILIVETYPEANNTSQSNTIQSLFAMTHQRKQKTFSDLHSCYLKDSLSCVQKKFPQLNFDECRKVQSDSILFFSQSILLDYLKMIHKSARSFLNWNSIPVDDLMIFCDELEKISDFTERIKNPIIMNFEFRSTKYRLRAEQVKDIELLTSEESGNFKSIVIQRMMAAGKTLVLGTISVVMKALKRNGKLSILVPPSSLYQSNTTSMQNRTYQYFKKRGNSFNFPRLPLASDDKLTQRISDFLDNTLNMINRTMINRDYLISSPDHLQSFLNSYIEAIDAAELLCTGDNYRKYIEILKKFASIYQIFKNHSSIILDEIDMTMDPKKELNFPTIDTEYYNMTAVIMLADIIEFMLFDQKIKDAGLNIHSNNQAALTPEIYNVCRDIVTDYIESQLQDDSSLWGKLVSKQETSGAIEFLKEKTISFNRDWIFALVEKDQSDLAKALIIVKIQLYLHLEEFLGATVNLNYGGAGTLRPEIKYAVPYVAANTPSTESVFADRWETLIKTILMISASSCSIETAKDVIKYVRKTINEESATSNSNLDFKSLPTYINISRILPKNAQILALDENNQLHVAMVHSALLPRSPAAIRILFGYYINEVLSKMEFPVEQITSNALHMTSMAVSVQGYSGTLSNVNILIQSAVEEASRDHEENEKNNGGIALKLIQDFNNEIILEMEDESAFFSETSMIKRFFELFKENNLPIDQIYAIIDTGALFKNFKNRAISEAILKYFNGRIKTVLYYDETSNQLEFINGTVEFGKLVITAEGVLETTDAEDIETKTHAKIDERFTFYDQRHITGSDILQPKSALAIMTAGPRVLLRDILQGTLRMRQFMTSQKVHLVITESVRKFYTSKINEPKEHIRVSDLLTLGALNEDEKQIVENEKLAFRKIDVEIRSFLLDEISRVMTQDFVQPNEFNRIMSIYRENRDLFVRSIREDPIFWLRDRYRQNTADVLQQHAQLRLEKVRPFFNMGEGNTQYELLVDRIGRMCKPEYEARHDSLLKYLEKEINVRIDDSNGTEVQVTNQTLTLTLTMMDLNMDQFVEPNINSLCSKQYKYDLLGRNPKMIENRTVHSIQNDYFSLKYIYENQPQSAKTYIDSILLTDGSQIGATTDLIQLFDNPGNSYSNFYNIFSRFNIEGTHLLVIIPLGKLDKPKVLLLSPRHASKVFDDLNNDLSRNYHFFLCDLYGDVRIASKSAKTVFNLDNLTVNILQIRELGKSLKSLLFDLLVFNGSFAQILANRKLRDIYENKWLGTAKARNRAMFLRMRMKALAEKDTIMFEDDDKDYMLLKKYSTGDTTKEQSGREYTGGYAKGAITKKMQALFTQANRSTRVNESITKNETLCDASSIVKTNMRELFEGTISANANDESFMNLSVVTIPFEDIQFEGNSQSIGDQYDSDNDESGHEQQSKDDLIKSESENDGKTGAVHFKGNSESKDDQNDSDNDESGHEQQSKDDLIKSDSENDGETDAESVDDETSLSGTYRRDKKVKNESNCNVENDVEFENDATSRNNNVYVPEQTKHLNKIFFIFGFGFVSFTVCIGIVIYLKHLRTHSQNDEEVKVIST